MHFDVQMCVYANVQIIPANTNSENVKKIIDVQMCRCAYMHICRYL